MEAKARMYARIPCSLGTSFSLFREDKGPYSGNYDIILLFLKFIPEYSYKPNHALIS